MFFFVITKNLNWEILIKNLVTFKRWDGVKDEKGWEFTEKPDFKKGGMKNQYTGGELPKRGANYLKKRGWCIWGGLKSLLNDTIAHRHKISRANNIVLH